MEKPSWKNCGPQPSEYIINKQLLQKLSGLGVVIFGLCLFISVVFEKPLQDTAISFLKKETTAQINVRIDRLLDIRSNDQGLLQKRFLLKYQSEVPVLKTQLKVLTDNMIDRVSRGQTKAERDIAWVQIMDGMSLNSKLVQYQVVKTAIGSLQGEVHQRYQQTWRALIRDIRIFYSTNLGSFLLLFILATLMQSIPRYLLLCASVLMFSTCLSIIIYVYGQNWFYTILFDRYYGTAYLSMLGFIFGYLLYKMTIEYVFCAIMDKAGKTD